MKNSRPLRDFDHHVPEHVENAYDTYAALRRDSPVFWSSHHGGFWGLARYEDAVMLSRDNAAFSARKWFDRTGTAHGGITIPTIQNFHLVPNETENPEWQAYRTALGPLFTPKAIARRNDQVLGYTTEILDHFIERGHFDFVLDFANPIPALMTLDIIGLPLDQWHKFALPWHISAYAPLGSDDAAYSAQGISWIARQIATLITDVRTRDGADQNLIGALVRATANGKPFSDTEILNMIIQVLAGGVDTTTALTANALLYLHRHHEIRCELADNPALMPTAVEEFMRYVTPIQGVSRTLTKDMSFNGATACTGERIMILLASANRDENEFARAGEVMLDRFPNRHMAWGLGTHRCLGSSLARLMFSTMVGEVLKRMPDYEILEDEAERYPTMSVVNGWIRMPARFTPGKKCGTGIPLPAFSSHQHHDYTA